MTTILDVLAGPYVEKAMWCLIGMTLVFVIWSISNGTGASATTQYDGAISGAVLLGLLTIGIAGFQMLPSMKRGFAFGST